MASEVDICNLALGHLGDSATVASINPPEGSAQAEHCQRFYPIARDSLLERHQWAFATTRTALAQVANPSTTFQYAYAEPNKLLNIISLLPQNATDDISAGIQNSNLWGETPLPGVGQYTPAEFQLETDEQGRQIILCNVQNAVLRYTQYVTDPTMFSRLFVECLTWSLAAMLAGPVMKGGEGARMGANCQQIAFGPDGRSGLFGLAASSDSGNRKSYFRDRHQVAWFAVR